jgi:hypothetical protein
LSTPASVTALQNLIVGAKALPEFVWEEPSAVEE